MRFCGYCDAVLWPDAPDEMVSTGNEVYCDEKCKRRAKYEARRERFDEPEWTHECSECVRPMFTPPTESDWWCPECDRTEKLDTSYWDWWRDEHYWDGDFEHPCPQCDNTLWLFDGALVCHDDECDTYIVQYGREWWALLEQEYPSKTMTEQTELNGVQ